MSERDRRPVPVPLGASGMWVPAESAGELAGALQLFRDLLMGRRPPAEVQLPRVTRVIDDLQAVAATVAREHQAERHRQIAAASVAQPKPQTEAPLLSPAQPGGSSDPATIDVRQAADLLHVSPQRVRALAASGRITARRGPRAVWELDRASTVAYRDRRARRRAHVSSRTEGGRASQS